MCTVRLRHKDKFARCRLFVLPGHSPALLDMPDIKLLDLVKILHEGVGDQQADRKFNFQIIQPCKGLSCKANKGKKIKTHDSDVNDVLIQEWQIISGPASACKPCIGAINS